MRVAPRTVGGEDPLDERLAAQLRWLAREGSAANRAGMARYAIRSDKLFGVSLAALRRRARTIGRDPALAQALWDAGWHETRLLAALVDDPAQLTPAQMDRRAAQFDNWAVCDSVCIALFVRTPHAWGRVAAWRRRRGGFVRRAAFALLAALAVHAPPGDDARFLRALGWIEAAATDERPFVRKALVWALRAIGGRNEDLHDAALGVAARLAGSDQRTPRAIGREAQRLITAAPRVARRSAP